MRRLFECDLRFRGEPPVATVTAPLNVGVLDLRRFPNPGSVTVAFLAEEVAPMGDRRFMLAKAGDAIGSHAICVGGYGSTGDIYWHVFELVGEPLPDGLDLPADAEAAYRTMTAAGFRSVTRAGDVADKGARSWIAPDNEPLTTELIMAAATLQEYGFGPVVSK